MSIFVDEHTKVVVQGLGCPEARRIARADLAAGTRIVATIAGGSRRSGDGAGIPGSGAGPGPSGLGGIAAFGDVDEAVATTGATASLILTAPHDAAAAIVAAAAAGVSLVVCHSPVAPAADRARLFDTLRWEHPGARVVGPASAGVIAPGRCSLGACQGDLPLVPGPVGVVARSARWTSMALGELARRSLGQSTAVGIGAGTNPGTSLLDCLAAFEADPETAAVLLVGEAGSDGEELAAGFIGTSMSKPVVAYVAGAGGAVGLVSPSRQEAFAKADAIGRAGAIVAGTLAGAGAAIAGLLADLS